MSNKESFFINDTPLLVFEARQPNPMRFDDPDGVAVDAENAEVRFFDTGTGFLVEIEGATFVDVSSDYVTVTPMDEAQDRGALIYVVIPPQVMEIPGKYTMYVTPVYDTGLRITENYKIDVLEYR